MIFGARDVNLSHLYPVRVSYPPKNIVTEAIQVTSENIGKLALEFEEELLLVVEGESYFKIQAERGTQDKPQTPRLYYIRPGMWIVPLRGEIHVYKDAIFQNTFDIETFISPDLNGQPSQQVRESLRGVVSETYSGLEEFKPQPAPLPTDDPLYDTGEGYESANTGQIVTHREGRLSDNGLWATGQISTEEHERRIAQQD